MTINVLLVVIIICVVAVLTEKIRPNFQYKGSNWWIGVSDKLAEGTWTLNSTGRPMPYSNWANGEPNGGTNENCAFLISSDGRWIDCPCTQTLWAMCEKVVQINSKGNKKLIF